MPPPDVRSARLAQHPVQLAAGAAAQRRCLPVGDAHVAQALRGQEVGQRGSCAAEGGMRVRLVGFEAQLQPVGRGAQQLEARDLRAFLDGGGQGQRQQRHLVPPRVVQHQRVVGAALHLDRRESGCRSAQPPGSKRRLSLRR